MNGAALILGEEFQRSELDNGGTFFTFIDDHNHVSWTRDVDEVANVITNCICADFRFSSFCKIHHSL